MNKEDKETIEEASNIVLLTTSVSATDETYSKDVYADEHAEKQEKYIDIAGGMALGATLLAAACDVMAGIELAMAFSGAPELIGESLAMSATAVLTSAAAVAAEVMVIKIGKSIEQGKKVKGEFEKADLNKPYLD
jgi:UDP-N-acetylenolpyruvoylglucosamine reductase